MMMAVLKEICSGTFKITFRKIQGFKKSVQGRGVHGCGGSIASL
jgi:hypothetical protein